MHSIYFVSMIPTEINTTGVIKAKMHERKRKERRERQPFPRKLTLFSGFLIS